MVSNCNKLLIQAIERNDSEAARRALQGGADVNVNNIDDFSFDCPSEYTPLFRAIQHGHDRIVRILLDAGADAQLADRWRRTAAHNACYGGHLAILQMLIDHDRDLLDKADSDGFTPLIEATSSQHT